jgi:hypothetical protein
MIDLKNETIITLQQATRLFPHGRNGRPMHISHLIKGILKGFNGSKLEALRCGSRWLTSVEACQRWVEAQAASATGAKAAVTPAHPGSRRKSKERASLRLDEIGF